MAGKRMRLLPNQREFIREVYGRAERDGTLIRSLGIQSEPKGNGKTGMVAALCLCHLLGPEAESRGEIYSAAIDRNQSGIIFQEMEAIIFAVPEFAARVNIQRFHKKIEDLETGSTYEALSSDARSAHGRAPSLWVYDELAQETDPSLLDNLMQGMSKRSEPLGLIISTQAETDSHPLSELIDDGLANASNKSSTFVQLTAVPLDADVFNVEVLKAANPAWGKFLNVKDLLEKRDRAMRMPSAEAAFRNLRGNQRVDAKSEKRLLAGAEWKRGNVRVLRANFRGSTCYGGLDLSGKHDLTALVLVFPDGRGGFDILPFFWTPLGQLEKRRPAERKLFKLWIEQGFMFGIPGEIIDYSFVAKEVSELMHEFKIKHIGYDRYRIDDFKAELKKVGVEDHFRNPKKPEPGEVLLQPHGQGFKDMAPAVDFFTECALQGRLRHGGHPVLTSSVANCIVLVDAAGNQKPDKAKSNKSGSVRIDGAVALIMALAASQRVARVPLKPSIDAFLKDPVMVI